MMQGATSTYTTVRTAELPSHFSLACYSYDYSVRIKRRVVVWPSAAMIYVVRMTNMTQPPSHRTSEALERAYLAQVASAKMPRYSSTHRLVERECVLLSVCSENKLVDS